MGNKIRVVIADDQAIAREGIQRILERESDIEIVGTVWTAPEVLPQVGRSKPDVLLLDLKWYGDDQAMNEVITQLRREYPETRIIGLTAHEDLVRQARAAGARWAITKGISKDELVSLIRAASGVIEGGDLERAWLALEHLRGLKPGEQNAPAYEEDVCTILASALYPHLTDPRLELANISGTRRRDILFSNYSSHPFWQRVSHRHDATLIVFEAKNVKRLEARYIDQVAGYLNPGLGYLGFIVSRTLPGDSILKRAVEKFQTRGEGGRVILFLCDDDLGEMLKFKEEKSEPTELIRRRYDDFIALT
jgi:DNA-binding NarL/FixJ family response regulator